METNQVLKVASPDVTPPPSATKSDSGSNGSAAGEEGDGPGGPEEITLKIANPLLRHDDAAAPLTPTPGPLESPSAAKLREVSKVWDELNAMPPTPPPQPVDQVDRSVTPGHSALSKKRHAIVFALAAAAVGAGVVAAVFALRRGHTPEAASPPAHESQAPAAGTPVKPMDPVPGKPVKPIEIAHTSSADEAAIPTAPAPRETRQIRITVQPAEATLVLDGTVAASNVIALERERDQALHMVEATAPGYLPFKQSFTLDGDIHLDINLKRPEPPLAKLRRPEPPLANPKQPEPPAEVTRQPERPSAPPAEPAQPIESVTKAKPVEAPAEDFGMDLQRSAPRRQIKEMDDKDPYSP